MTAICEYETRFHVRARGEASLAQKTHGPVWQRSCSLMNGVLREVTREGQDVMVVGGMRLGFKRGRNGGS